MQKKFVTLVASIILFLGANIVLAGHGEEETPRDGLNEILRFYKDQNWEGIVKERCLDTQHAETKKAVDALVESLEKRVSNTDTFNAVVSSYEAALITQPRFESEGSVAIFASQHGTVTLSKMDTGVWGLRL